MNILDIVTHTPLYIWLVFGYLIFIGIKSTKAHIIPIPFLFTAPFIITTLRYNFFLKASLVHLLMYSLTIIIGLKIGTRVASLYKSKLILYKNSIELPGNIHSLILFITYFSIQYFFGALSAINRPLYQELIFIEILTRGLFTGFLLGKTFFYVYFYYKNQ
jgi:uncharacterized membrane protein AbrB (regulator of aidB expression)